MFTKENALKTATAFLQELKASGYHPAEAWLFGSIVSGAMQEHSDIDLAVWDKNFSGVLHQDYEKIARILVKFKNIELHSFPYGETESDDPFIGIIKRNGEQIKIN